MFIPFCEICFILLQRLMKQETAEGRSHWTVFIAMTFLFRSNHNDKKYNVLIDVSFLFVLIAIEKEKVFLSISIFIWSDHNAT